MNEITKGNTNNVIVIKELHLHKHTHKTLIVNQLPKPAIKRLSPRVRTIQIKCVVCNRIKLVKPGTKFCSKNCWLKYQDYKHKAFKVQQNKVNEQTKPKSWYQKIFN